MLKGAEVNMAGALTLIGEFGPVKEPPTSCKVNYSNFRKTRRVLCGSSEHHWSNARPWTIRIIVCNMFHLLDKTVLCQMCHNSVKIFYLLRNSLFMRIFIGNNGNGFFKIFISSTTLNEHVTLTNQLLAVHFYLKYFGINISEWTRVQWYTGQNAIRKFFIGSSRWESCYCKAGRFSPHFNLLRLRYY